MLSTQVLQQIVAVSRDGIVVSEAKGNGEHLIVFVNPAFEQQTGYSAVEIIGRDALFLNSQGSKLGELDEVRQALASGLPCEATLRNYTKAGRAFWNQMSLFPVVDAAGVVTHYLAIQRDISSLMAADDSIRQHKTRAHELEQMTLRDPLTSLHNRRYLYEQLERLWAVHQRLGARLAFAFVDIDAFKRFNDLYGHVRGDEALQKVSQVLAEHFKRDTDVLVRYGGEEFVIAASLATDTPPFESQLERARLAIEALGIEHEGARLGKVLTVSIGLTSTIPNPTIRTEDLLHAADLAMYEAKAQGGNQLKTSTL